MAYQTEQEQIESLKKWWEENGRGMVAGVVIALLGYSGWGFWQDRQQALSEAASAEYETLVKMLDAPEDIDPDAFNAGVETLKGEYSGSFYADAALLLQARLAVESGDLEQAASALLELKNSVADQALQDLVNLRLARVYFSQQKYDEALSILAASPGESFISAFEELHGDVLLAVNKPSEAIESYQMALDKLEASGSSSRQYHLQMKLDDLSAASASTHTQP